VGGLADEFENGFMDECVDRVYWLINRKCIFASGAIISAADLNRPALKRRLAIHHLLLT